MHIPSRYVLTPSNGGLVDIGRVLAGLDGIGYTSPVLVEYQGEDPLNILPRDVEFLRSFDRAAAVWDSSE